MIWGHHPISREGLAGSRSPRCSAPGADPLTARPPPDLSSRPLPELGTAKAQVAVPARRDVVALARGAYVPRVVEPRATPEDAVGGLRRSRVAPRSFAIIRRPDIRAPLPDVPQHVVQPPLVRGLPAG